MMTLALKSPAIEHMDAFKKICGGKYVLADEASLHNSSHDETEHLHIRIKSRQTANSLNDEKMAANLRSLFKLVYKLGGTISGEHGIGLIQKEYMPIVFSLVQLRLMKSIKVIFDLNNILNAGKIFD